MALNHLHSRQRAGRRPVVTCLDGYQMARQVARVPLGSPFGPSLPEIWRDCPHVSGLAMSKFTWPVPRIFSQLSWALRSLPPRDLY
jgi:hypothetical protein